MAPIYSRTTAIREHCPRGRRAECLSYYFFPTPRRDADLVRRGGGLTDAREVLDIHVRGDVAVELISEAHDAGPWQPLSLIASLMVVVARRFEVLAGATRRREGARHRRREFGAARGELGAAPAEKQSTPR